MKQTISLLLVLALCLSLCACGEAAPQETTIDPEVQAFQDAEALLEAGEYEAAIAAFSAIGNYQQIADKITQAQLLLDEQRNSFLYGNWKDLNSLTEVSFDESGMGVFKTLNSSETFLFTIQDGIVTLPAGLVAKVTEIDGVTHLISDAHDLVKEENYEALAPEAIELTLENWETYFEIREAQDDYYNEMGELEQIVRCLGIFLREEYIERMTDMPLDISFKATVAAHWYQVLTEDFASGIYEIGEQSNLRDLEGHSSEPWSVIEEVRYRTSSKTSDFYQKYAAPFLERLGYTDHKKKEYFTYIVDSLQVEAVQGILYLKRQ